MSRIVNLYAKMCGFLLSHDNDDFTEMEKEILEKDNVLPCFLFFTAEGSLSFGTCIVWLPQLVVVSVGDFPSLPRLTEHVVFFLM